MGLGRALCVGLGTPERSWPCRSWSLGSSSVLVELWLPRRCAWGEYVCPKFEFCELLGGGGPSPGKVCPSAWGGPLVSFFLQPEVTGEGPTRETHTLLGSSTEKEAGEAEGELFGEP